MISKKDQAPKVPEPSDKVAPTMPHNTEQGLK
jgi:hypothetical protein